MAKITQIHCDRCGVLLTPANWLVDEEICNDCALLISAGQEAVKQALIQRVGACQTAREWLDQYQSEPSD